MAYLQGEIEREKGRVKWKSEGERERGFVANGRKESSSWHQSWDETRASGPHLSVTLRKHRWKDGVTGCHHPFTTRVINRGESHHPVFTNVFYKTSNERAVGKKTFYLVVTYISTRKKLEFSR